jgi:hypothetical protein
MYSQSRDKPFSIAIAPALARSSAWADPALNDTRKGELGKAAF